LDFTRWCLFICQEMNGWIIDDVMELGITQFVQVRNYLQWRMDEEQKAMKHPRSSSSTTFR